MFRLLQVFLLLAASLAVSAAHIPDFTANYTVTLNGIPAGEQKRSLQTIQDGSRHFKTVTEANSVFAFFKPDVIEESSSWVEKNDSILPLSYHYQRTGGKKEKFLDMNFDWSKSLVHIDDRHRPWQLKIEAGTQDKLAYQIKLMQDLALGQRQFNYQIADGGKLKNYQIEIIGEEKVMTPLGEINAIKLTRVRKEKSERQTTLWCAPELSFFPVKLEHIEDGTTFTAVVRVLKGINTQAFEKTQADNQFSNVTTYE